MVMEEEPERPRAVTVIGWIWIVVGGLYFLRSIVDLVMWRALQPAAPALLRELESRDPELRFVRPMFEHLTAIKIAQLIAGVAVVFLAYELLRLRPRARVGIQIVCWIVLCYVFAFAALWIRIWTRALALAPDDPRFAGPHGRLTLALGLGLSAALATGLIVMIVLLRSSQMRHAFERPDVRVG
ncbi:MAG TPA: hypothetical protein VEO37_01595 [Thermoanaerobaculia bacterium]|nr:hypothetical protein [Thermoanaerobaculia bacterium]